MENKIKFDTKLKAPFPYFGSKRIIADVVWKYIGDVKQYIEPFFGSEAVLLRRPPSKHNTVVPFSFAPLPKNGFKAKAKLI